MASATHSGESHSTRKASPAPSSTRPSAVHALADCPKPEEAKGDQTHVPDDGQSHLEAAPDNTGVAGRQTSGFQNATEENTNFASAGLGCPAETRVSSSTSSTRAEQGSVRGGPATPGGSQLRVKKGETGIKIFHIQPPVGGGLLQGVGTNFHGVSQGHTDYPYPKEIVLDVLDVLD